MPERRFSFVVWASATLLALFYAAAIMAPVVAPYDFAMQNRAFPHCPPSSLHLNLSGDWGTGLFYTHPSVLADPVTRRYEEQISVRVPIRLFSGGHLFTTLPQDGKFSALGEAEVVVHTIPPTEESYRLLGEQIDFDLASRTLTARKGVEQPKMEVTLPRPKTEEP